MKCIVVFLVLSMVVAMAEPGECFLGLLFHAGKAIHQLITGKAKMEDQQQQLDKRSVDYNPGH
ncbi:pteroicidin-alpha-like [Brachyistius frenatus]|uniref:pteroicidin-alpha-like n=1 Tax=Brachyistius frenatus TaxID=100188 RepID=UPI0037E84B31